jgi:hypothetical protein
LAHSAAVNPGGFPVVSQFEIGGRTDEAEVILEGVIIIVEHMKKHIEVERVPCHDSALLVAKSEQLLQLTEQTLDFLTSVKSHFD